MKAKYFPWVLIVALVFMLVLQRECQRCPPAPEPTTITHIDTVTTWDTITQVVQSQPVVIYDTLEIPATIDTAAALADYYTRRSYQDTITDTVFQIIIADQVYMNRLLTRTTKSSVFVPTITIYRTDSLFIPCPPAKALVFFGVGIGGWDDKFSIAPGLALVTKRRNMYMLNYDPLNKVAQVHNYWKIGKR